MGKEKGRGGGVAIVHAQHDARTLILNARLKPDAKKPPNGATNDANTDIATACSIILEHATSSRAGTHVPT